MKIIMITIAGLLLSASIHAQYTEFPKAKFTQRQALENEATEKTGSRGGRPKKKIKKDHLIGVKCTNLEKTVIIHKAKKVCVTPSEYLRILGVKGQVDRKIKVLPKEVLEFIGTLNHMAANLNQVAKKRNREETFNDMERDEFFALCKDIQELAHQIKKYLQ